MELSESLLQKAELLSGLTTEAVLIEALQVYIKQIDKQSIIREFGEQLSSFKFWESSEENVYNDLIQNKS